MGRVVSDITTGGAVANSTGGALSGAIAISTGGAVAITITITITAASERVS